MVGLWDLGMVIPLNQDKNAGGKAFSREMSSALEVLESNTPVESQV